MPARLIASASTVLSSGDCPVPLSGHGTDDLRASTTSDLRKQGGSTDPGVRTAREYTQALQDRSWINHMAEGKTLRDMLLDSKVSNTEFAKAAAVGLQTKFPQTNLNKYTIYSKETKEKYIQNWRATILALSVYYRTFKKFATAHDLSEYLQGHVHEDIIEKYLSDPETELALSNLGISMPNAGLSEKQLLALSIISSFTDARPLNQKLKSIGVMHWEFNNWLGYPKFSAAYRRITEDLLSEVQPVINTSLVQLATGTGPASNGKPDLAAIKYLNEVNGRWDPSSRQALDVRIVITKMIEILTSEITDPELLRRIGARLQAVVQVSNIVQQSIEPDKY